MSWIVQSLWNNRDEIKNKYKRSSGILTSFVALYGVESEFDEDLASYEDPCTESDEFNDLLIIEKAVSELRELGLLSEEDLDVLYQAQQDGLNKNQKYWQNRKLYFVCERIAYYLGGYFTDEGYINYLTKKYRLTPEQQDVAREYMRSQFKNRKLNKAYRIENNDEKFRTVSAQV